MLLAANDLPISDISSIAQFGLLGLLVLMFLTKKWIVPRWTLDDQQQAYERQLKDRDDTIATQKADLAELKATNAELQNLARDRLIPALVESNRLSAAYVQELSRRASTPVSGVPNGTD